MEKTGLQGENGAVRKQRERKMKLSFLEHSKRMVKENEERKGREKKDEEIIVKENFGREQNLGRN